MSEPFLICHIVRGFPAFDIATQMPCPECSATGCPECDDLGYWWIVPTSGHRAYPYWTAELSTYINLTGEIPAMPSAWPDHYQLSTPTSRPSFLSTLTSSLRAPAPPINRRRI